MQNENRIWREWVVLIYIAELNKEKIIGLLDPIVFGLMELFSLFYYLKANICMKILPHSDWISGKTLLNMTLSEDSR